MFELSVNTAAKLYFYKYIPRVYLERYTSDI